MSGPKIHLICNAHLDPVWKWEWEEGLTEALATFETAADLLDEDPDLIFNHNESLLYEWTKEYRPDLFERIGKHVAAGRWHIAGGWYLQPDCNMPDGESFVRQILVGREFFRKNFGVETRLAYNFDAFGHHGNLPQILVKAGYRAYVHFRPGPKDLKLPGDRYLWEGIDGSRVLAYRPPFAWYGTDDTEDLRARIEWAEKTASGPVGLFWGLGDHGGGATRADLNLIRKVRKTHPSIFHSSTDAFLADLEKGEAPLWKGDLQRVFTGCYTSAIPAKISNRRSESLVRQAERYAALAWWYLGRPYPAEKMERVWKDVLFNQFHDILPGSSTRSAMAGAAEIAGRGMKEAREVILASQLALIRSKKRRDPLTIAVFNPHAYACRLPVDLEYMAAHRPIITRYVRPRITDASGKDVPSQEEMGTSVSTRFDWRKRVIFEADLPAAGYAEFRLHLDTLPEKPARIVPKKLKREWRWETAHYSFAVDGRTGFVKHLSRKGEKNLLGSSGGILRTFRDGADAWGSDVWQYREDASDFRLATPDETAKITGLPDLERVAPIREIESGPVRTVLECLFVAGASTASIRYFLYRRRPEIEAEVRVIWNAPGRQLKWVWPTIFAGEKYVAEIPYGDIARKQGEGEHVHLRWLGLRGSSRALGIAGIGPSGHDVDGGSAAITLLRSAIYTRNVFHNLRGDIFHDFMDLGEHRFRFALIPTTPRRMRADCLRVTERLSMPAAALAHYPPAASARAGVPPEQNLVSVDGAELGALKPAENSRGLIARLVERNGRLSPALLKIAGLAAIRVDLGPYEIKTLRIRRDGSWSECDLLERPLKK